MSKNGNKPPDFLDKSQGIGQEIFNIIVKNWNPKTPWDSFIIVLGAMQATQMLMAGYMKKMMSLEPKEPGKSDGGIHLPDGRGPDA